MNTFMRGIKAKVENVYTRLKMNGMGLSVMAFLFAENKEELQGEVDTFSSVYDKEAKSECWGWGGEKYDGGL